MGEFGFQLSSAISKIVEELQLKLHYEKINEIKNPNILMRVVEQVIIQLLLQQGLRSSKVLAIDLSLSSLAYAKRKTNELAIENIEYMPDILDLGKLNKQFDIIEILVFCIIWIIP